MGLFDKAKDLAAQHSDKISQGIEKAGDLIDQKTGGKYADQVDRAQDFARDRVDDLGGRDGADPAGTHPTEPHPPAAPDGPPPTS
ncbi:hypothetical protein FHX74_003054 [Friedmanniella endophytica]|uniref:MT0933-like antitoxin protein n=1 Tax=Microlunatus kandeliicorticis TaxID=1759536 RepID=A0A7W3P6X1_9ACTN|nr:hypothetical protein [Microlunatus kandeliicorticis]